MGDVDERGIVVGGLIWLASYPKSGNTWLRAFLHNLFINSSQPVSLGDLDRYCLGESDRRWYAPYLDDIPLAEKDVSGLERTIAEIRPRVHVDFSKTSNDSVFVKTHNHLGLWFGYPLHNMEVTSGAIYIVRNPLDLVISMHHHFARPLDWCIDLLNNEGAKTALSQEHVHEVYASWSTHVKSWTQRENDALLVLRYEDMLARPLEVFMSVAHFLGLTPPHERLARAVEHSSFHALKAQEKVEGFKEKPPQSDAFFRSGQQNQWRNEAMMTPERIERVVKRHGALMERWGYLPE